ncbi:MAG: F0F1 ATP synthase subunit epsilon [Chloroflexaceae bacterium]|nr:F0F1 ATP synthase subunit epsilon [Chloroflexaceae bacterium]
MTIKLEIVTAEQVVLIDEIDQLNAPTKDGRVGILPKHTPLLTILDIGELDIIKGGERNAYAIAGGFMEVLPDRITILSDTVERADDIDEQRAEEARVRAEEVLRQSDVSQEDVIAAESELRLALTRLRVSQLKRHSR